MSVSGHDLGDPRSQDVSLSVHTSPHARAKRKIATLMEDIEILKQDKAAKNRCERSRLFWRFSAASFKCRRKTTYYVSQGRAIRRMVILYTPIEDLVSENDRRCEETDDGSTVE